MEEEKLSKATKHAARSWRPSWESSHDWLCFDGGKAWCTPCRLFPLMASKHSIVNPNDGYKGEAKHGFKYDPIINHYQRKTKEKGVYELVLSKSNATAHGSELLGGKKKKEKGDLMESFIQQVLNKNWSNRRASCTLHIAWGRKVLDWMLWRIWSQSSCKMVLTFVHSTIQAIMQKTSVIWCLKGSVILSWQGQFYMHHSTIMKTCWIVKKIRSCLLNYEKDW